MISKMAREHAQAAFVAILSSGSISSLSIRAKAPTII